MIQQDKDKPKNVQNTPQPNQKMASWQKGKLLNQRKPVKQIQFHGTQHRG